jgi:two-component system response regulator NreC
MSDDSPVNSCVLLAERHHGLTEGVRGLLQSAFDTVVMVADEASLTDTAQRLRPTLVVVDLSLGSGDGLGFLVRLRARCPKTKVIVISVHDELSVRESALAAGADGFVVKRAIATELLNVVDRVLELDPARAKATSPSAKPSATPRPSD